MPQRTDTSYTAFKHLYLSESPLERPKIATKTDSKTSAVMSLQNARVNKNRETYFLIDPFKTKHMPILNHPEKKSESVPSRG